MELKDIFRVLKRGRLILILLPLIAMITGGILSYYTWVPVYRASTTLIVGKNYSGENGHFLQYNDILIANQLINTYSQLAKSRTVAEKVIELEKLQMTPAQLSSKINVQSAPDTQLIQIAIQDSDPNRAARLANLVGQVFMQEVVEVMKLDNVSIVDAAVASPVPVNNDKKLNILIAGVLGLMTAVGLVFLREYLDQTIKTSEDVNNVLDLPVLGVIPKIDS